MMKASSNCDRETCSLCSKFIYKHQPVVLWMVIFIMVSVLVFAKTHAFIFSRVQFLTGFVQLVPGKFFQFMMIFLIYHMKSVYAEIVDCFEEKVVRL